MSSVSTFGTFTMAKLGIYASQKALDATGNNIANVNTPGYTRQRIDQYSLYMGGADRYAASSGAMSVKIGNGAMVDGVSQLRDKYLDIRYRNEQSSVGAMDKKLDVLSQLASILDEVGDGTDGEGVLEAQMNDLMTQLQNLANPNIGTGREVADTLVRSAAFAVTKTFNQYAERLETLRQTQDASFRNDVDRVNDILESIRDLNNSIRKSQIHGSDALEQQDERNNLIDELSQYVRISVTTEQEDLGDGWMVDKLVIKLNGNEINDPNNTNSAVLVDGVYATQFSIRQIEVKDANNQPVMDANNQPVMEDSPYYDMDIGPLKDSHDRLLEEKTVSILTNADGAAQTFANPTDAVTAAEAEKARLENALTSQPADRKISYTYAINTITIPPSDADLAINPNAPPTQEFVVKMIEVSTSKGRELSDNTLYGSLQSAREMLSEQGEFATQKQIDADTNALTKRGIPYYQKSLDSLANQFATLFNEANKNATGGVLFSNDGTTNDDGVDDSSKPNNPSDPDNIDDTTDKTVITAANISISLGWSSGTTRIVTTTQSGDNVTTANDNVALMLSQFMNGEFEFKLGAVAPDAYNAQKDENGKDRTPVYFKGTLQAQLMNMWEVMSSDAKTTSDMYNNYNTSLDELYVNRDAVSGVDLNDEAMNMMQYQKSYSAACRLLTTIDELIDKLVNGTGRAGL